MHVSTAARDSIGHVKKCLFGTFVEGGSVGRASVFHAKDVGWNLALVNFFSRFFFLIIIF